jgi:hypothetical protein
MLWFHGLLILHLNNSLVRFILGTKESVSLYKIFSVLMNITAWKVLRFNFVVWDCKWINCSNYFLRKNPESSWLCVMNFNFTDRWHLNNTLNVACTGTRKLRPRMLEESWKLAFGFEVDVTTWLKDPWPWTKSYGLTIEISYQFEWRNNPWLTGSNVIG